MNILNNKYFGSAVVYGLSGIFLKTYTINQNAFLFCPENIKYTAIKKGISFNTAKQILKLCGKKNKNILKNILEIE